MTNCTNTLNSSLLTLQDVLKQQNLTFGEFEQILSLGDESLLRPKEINGLLYLTYSQANLLDSLQPLLKDIDALKNLPLHLEEGALLYQCRSCGQLKVTHDLLLGKELVHRCNILELKARLYRGDFLLDKDGTPLGKFSLIASGSLEEIILWAHSIALRLDHSLKCGI